MHFSKKKNNSYLNYLLKTYPKKKPPLSIKIKKIFNKEYKFNRENKLNSFLESWMHKSIVESKKLNQLNTLELGAGTLNHLPFENIKSKEKYDIIEPKKYLFNKKNIKKKIHKIFLNYHKVPYKFYDRIISCATLEHLTNLPEFLAISAFKLKNKNSYQSHSVPCEGYFFWFLANKCLANLIFWLKTRCNYMEIMRHEHLNNYDEILKMIKFFYKKVKVKHSFPLFFSPHLAFYSNIYFSNPNYVNCKKYIFLLKKNN